jgi:hypothetical protein
LELFFASYFNRRWSITSATTVVSQTACRPTRSAPELQRDFVVNIVREQGLDRSYFSNMDQLYRAVLNEDWPKKSERKPRSDGIACQADGT